MTKRRLCAIMVIVGGRRLARRTPTIIERERIRKIRRIFRVGGRGFASRTPTIIEREKDQEDPEDIPCRRAGVRKPHADDHRKVFLRCLLLSCCRIMAKNGVWYCLNCSIMLCCACIRRSWKCRAIDIPNWDKRGRAFSPPVLAWRVDFFLEQRGSAAIRR